MGRVDDVGFNIGRTLLELKHDRKVSSPSVTVPREVRISDSKPHYQYEKARTLSSTPPLRISHTHLHSPEATHSSVSLMKPALHPAQTSNRFRPTQNSSADQIPPPPNHRFRRRPSQSGSAATCVHRPLSPFNRSRPTTSAETLLKRILSPTPTRPPLPPSTASTTLDVTHLEHRHVLVPRFGRFFRPCPSGEQHWKRFLEQEHARYALHLCLCCFPWRNERGEGKG